MQISEVIKSNYINDFPKFTRNIANYVFYWSEKINE